MTLRKGEAQEAGLMTQVPDLLSERSYRGNLAQVDLGQRLLHPPHAHDRLSHVHRCQRTNPSGFSIAPIPRRFCWRKVQENSAW